MTRQYITFLFDNQLYGVDITVIREVIPNIPILPIPRSKSHIHGLVNIRGQVILVMDAALVIGFSRRTVNKETHIIILKNKEELERVRNRDPRIQVERYGDKSIGFLVDGICDVVTVDEKDITLPPPQIDEAGKKYLWGVVRREKLLTLLNTDEILQ